MIHQFDGERIFGSSTTTVEGPTGDYRVQVDTLPGVAGERIYRLGGGPVEWRIRGRLTALSVQQLKAQVIYAGGYRDGNLYTFTDSDGVTYRYCRLTDYRAIGPIEGVTFGNNQGGATCECEARVVCESPKSPNSVVTSPFPVLS